MKDFHWDAQAGSVCTHHSFMHFAFLFEKCRTIVKESNITFFF